jgi:putative acetyltransferase
VIVRDQTPGDRIAVRAVHLAAFPTKAEAELVSHLDHGGHVVASLVAEEAGKVVGHILFSRLATSGPVGAALAPVAVMPDFQGLGIGSALVWAGLDACEKRDYAFLVVLGDPDFYQRFGFSAELGSRIDARYSGPAFQALELKPGALAEPVRVTYPEPFSRLT